MYTFLVTLFFTVDLFSVAYATLLEPSNNPQMWVQLIFCSTVSLPYKPLKLFLVEMEIKKLRINVSADDMSFHDLSQDFIPVFIEINSVTPRNPQLTLSLCRTVRGQTWSVTVISTFYAHCMILIGLQSKCGFCEVKVSIFHADVCSS